MYFDLYPQCNPFNMLLSIRIQKPMILRLSVFDRITKRMYAKRRIRLDKSRKVLLKFPFAPNELTTCIEQEDQTGTKELFGLDEIKVLPDTRCFIKLTDKDKQFIRFIKWFTTEVESLEAGQKGTIYQSEDFSLLYVDVLKNGTTELTTPARIERDSGLIEVSKQAINDYTVPMLSVVLLHEYAHIFKNPEYGKDINNELTADIIAVHIALNLGFDEVETEHCFKAIFSKKDTDLNRRRLKAVQEFIQVFKKSESKRCNCKTCNT